MSELKRVCIIGAGCWGSVIARIIGANVAKIESLSEEVTLYVHEEIINGQTLTEIINETHENIKYLPGYKLPDNVIAISDVVEAAKDADFIMFVVPQEYISSICSELYGKIKPTAAGVSLIKGFESTEDGNIELISHSITRQLKIQISVLMGANIFNEVADEKFCETTLGCKDKSLAAAIKDLFQTEYFRVNVVDDVDAVEICGSIRNIIACGEGFVAGLELGHNAKSTVLKLGLIEMVKFVDIFYPGSKLSTFFESCGVADLATSYYGGRNCLLSEAFIKTGKSVVELQDEMLNGSILEGPHTAGIVNYMLQHRDMENKFPLLTAVHKIFIGELKPHLFLDTIRSHTEHSNVRLQHLTW